MQIVLKNGLVSQIDDEDLETANKFNLYPHKAGRKVYVQCYRTNPDGSREQALLHRLITNAPKGFDVDHINGDGLDNRKSNLRVTTRTINNLNRPDSKGCYFDKITGRWRADLWVNKKRIRLGRFDTFEQARAAYLARKEAEMSAILNEAA